MTLEPLVNWMMWGLIALFIGLCIRRVLRDREQRRREEQRLCPHCGYDLRACVDRCSECGRLIGAIEGRQLDARALSDGWPASPMVPRLPAPTEQSVAVFQTSLHVEAHLLTAQLEARGMCAGANMVESAQRPSPYAVGRHYVWEVCVYEADAERANAYIDSIRLPPLFPSEQAGVEHAQGSAKEGNDGSQADKTDPAGLRVAGKSHGAFSATRHSVRD